MLKNKQVKKSIFIKTYGCQMNVRDSEVVCGLLVKGGFDIVDEPDTSDIVLFNTCSVRQHAEDKVWSEIGSICKRYARGARAKESTVTVAKSDSHLLLVKRNTQDAIRNTKPIIGIIGCMAQNYKESIFERAPDVDFVVGPSDIHKIPGIIAKVISFAGLSANEEKEKGEKEKREKRGQSLKSGDSPLFSPPFSSVFSRPLFSRKVWETDGVLRPDEVYHTGFYGEKDHAFVVISEGCSNFCSYCVVPFVRGELHHRNYEDILKEIEETIGNGISRITLLGQNVNAYKSQGAHSTRLVRLCSPQVALSEQASHKGQVDFIELLKLVNNIQGIKEFSFITSHPKDTSVELFEAMQGLDKFKKYLHLPAQSGSDRILKAMNRGYTRKFYLELVRNYRKIVKEGELTTDIIVGFPGETEVDFQDTYSLVKEVRFNSAYIFKYSGRPHTAAARMEDDVPKEEKERRHSLILGIQKEISRSLKPKSFSPK